MTSEMLNTAEELNAAHNDPKYYDFLVNEYGFTRWKCYYEKVFRDGALMAQYYPFEHSYRIYGKHDQQFDHIIMLVPAETKQDLEYLFNRYYNDMLDK